MRKRDARVSDEVHVVLLGGAGHGSCSTQKAQHCQCQQQQIVLYGCRRFLSSDVYTESSCVQVCPQFVQITCKCQPRLCYVPATGTYGVQTHFQTSTFCSKWKEASNMFSERTRFWAILIYLLWLIFCSKKTREHTHMRSFAVNLIANEG